MSMDSLSLYGNTFQTKIITCLIKDVSFLSQVSDVLDPTFFEMESSAELVKIIRDRYYTSKNITTLEIFKVEIAKLRNNLLSESMIEKLKEVISHTDDSDLDYVKSEFLKFCKNQSMKYAILKSADLLNRGDYDQIYSIIKESLKVGTDRNIGLVYEEVSNVHDRLHKRERSNLIQTEWSVINEILDGGLSPGDLGILIGNAGSGKSWILTSIGLHALKMGKNVLHVTLELSEDYTSKRYDTKLTGISSNNLKYHINEVEEAIKEHIKGKLNIKYYPTKSVTVNALKAIVEKLIMMDRKPDLIIVDYGDLLKSDNPAAIKQGSYQESGTIYEELRGLAGEFQVPVWTASQSHRGSGEKDIITGEDVSESYKKIMIADFVLSVSRKTEDKLLNTARWFVIKNRYGIDGITFPGVINTSIGNIDIYSPNSINGEQTQKTMNTGNEVLRKSLAKKFKEFSDFEDENDAH